MSELRDRRILLGVSASIAAFKAVSLASELVKQEAIVDVIMTPNAARFVAPLSFEAIVRRPVILDLFAAADPTAHVSLGADADAYIVAPATADCIAGLALGLADDAVRTIALATRAPLLIAPAMETRMYEHPATRAHLATLRARGALILEPGTGRLASGRIGQGRIAEPSEILAALVRLLGRTRDLAGRCIVVTAGGTQEPIDPVRHISNRSSGKMGYAIAEAARDRGARVILISAPTAIAPPDGVELRRVTTALDMKKAVEEAVIGADALIMAAAVADYRVAAPAEQKIKRTGEEYILRLIPNPDIIAGIRQPSLIKVGFAAETQDLIANARKKLEAKDLDFIVANDVSAPDSGFGSDTNRVTIIDRQGLEALPLLSKREVADRILDRIASLLRSRLADRPG
ncbi:MAG TPA: bifunctional phosphopantothenoylcysteine decarboxylase/phosphopantothenate--cysteine ligase CoaBC [Chloroflexota bacterium]|nr:bifunctional phosphopantothenoylcysteine decarboxylase/phosphopantothenate--cysteine ligase CoaBC [Chloroflexota bacterium]